MSDDFLRLDVEVLLCRYGRQKVLSALAEIESCRPGDITASLAKLRAKKAAKKGHANRRTLLDTLEDLRGSPERVDTLRSFVVAYENRALFPTLKSVQRFLESRGEPASGVKSRKAAGPSVLRVLSLMTGPELAELVPSIRADGQSDFSLLSGAILRTGDRA